VAVFDLSEDEVGLLLLVASALGRDDELAAAVVGVGAPLHIAERFELIDEPAHVLLGLPQETGELGGSSPGIVEIAQESAVAGSDLVVATLSEAGEELLPNRIEQPCREQPQVGVATYLLDPSRASHAA